MPIKITANMVTMGRIILLPLPCALLMSGSLALLWVAAIIFILLGATDFVDGAMARRDGPTKLGGLIDPAADKIFVAAITLSMVGIGLVPVWFVVLIFLRELLMTTLRSSVALRRQSIKTSVLGKFKTIVQMGGIGTIFLTIYGNRFWMLVFAAALCIILTVLGIVLAWKNKKYPPVWIFPVAFAFLYWFLLLMFTLPEVAVWLQMIAIVALTWVSAIDYFRGTYQIFARSGFYSYDLVRIFWAFSFSLCVLPFSNHHITIVIFILISIAFELALGGVDNVVAADKARVQNYPFVASGLVSVVFGMAMYLNTHYGLIVNPVWLTVLLSVASAIIFISVYRRWHYLFARVLD